MPTLSFVLFLLAAAPQPGPPGIGDRAPPVDVATVDGGRRAPLQSASGEVLVVDFFATWCSPCHRALADLAAIRDQTPTPRLRFLLVDAGESAETVKAFLAHTAVPGGTQVVVDPSGAIARSWGAEKLPTTFLVDADGVIRHINRGWGSGYRARLGAWLRGMLAAGRDRQERPVREDR